jgi:hypothetical protein
MKISARNSLHLQEDIAVGFLDFQNPEIRRFPLDLDSYDDGKINLVR